MGLCNLLQHRLTGHAAAELSHLEGLLQEVNLEETPDQRASFFEDNSHRLLSGIIFSGIIYCASMRGDHACPSYNFVWRNFAPPRVKFFGWLLAQNRIQCRTSLLRKNILEDARCEVCGQEDETADHIISGCSFVCSFWMHIG